MAEPHYVLYADRPLLQRVPWWAWVLGIGLIVVLVAGRGGKQKDATFEDYLR